MQHVLSDTWAISGLWVKLGLSMTIESGIGVREQVQVTGRVLSDGTWLASAIQRITGDTFDFVGVVGQRDPWIVGGIALVTDDGTDVNDDIDIGGRVRVFGRVLPGGR